GARVHPRAGAGHDAAAARPLCRVRTRAPSVRPPDRQEPGDRRRPRGHAAAAGHESPARLPNGRPEAGGKATDHGAVAGEAARQRELGADRARGRSDPRRQRLHAFAGTRARAPRRDRQPHLFGHLRDPARDHRLVPRPLTDGGLLHDLPLRSAERAPDATALRHGDEALTYAELVDRTHRFANLLIAEGVRPGEPVLLHLRKSSEAIVSLLAIL